MASRTRSSYVLWAVMAVPAAGMLGSILGGDDRAFRHLLGGSGEWAARLMILGMMASGLALLFRGQFWPRWLMRHRRDIEVGAFLYALLHTWVYVVERGSLDRILDALPQTFIWTGWAALLIFLPLGLTSNDLSQRWLRTGWKAMQRLAYPAAVLVLVHWAALHDWGSWPPAAVHFGPLIGLWAYRLWYWYLRPRSPQVA